MSYSNWDGGQPLGRDANCGALDTEYGYFMKWFDMTCHVKERFICEKEGNEYGHVFAAHLHTA